eukprot:CAMPEP_0119149668 /NCGR_PEP_ID=MMETSP1310-20130426/43689_1 /TAXON_ID=464262 /ORGANISM="Genus nov. species nov., Strain RCC2339" /LENGTH=152 /DNA_ID=CAMNT_0007141791 /DNA_START=27 /DNA_END=485 /DNA_ORIENTATION=+
MECVGREEWRATAMLPAGGVIEYKYVLCDGGGEVLAWQPGSNLVLEVPSRASPSSREAPVVVEDEWEGHPPAENIDAPLNARMSIVSRMLARVTAADLQTEEALSNTDAVSMLAIYLLMAGRFPGTAAVSGAGPRSLPNRSQAGYVPEASSS